MTMDDDGGFIPRLRFGHIYFYLYILFIYFIYIFLFIYLWTEVLWFIYLVHVHWTLACTKILNMKGWRISGRATNACIIIIIPSLFELFFITNFRSQSSYIIYGVLAFRLFRIRLFRVRLFRIRLFRVRLFRVPYSVFAYSVFAYSVFAYSVFVYSVFAYSVFAYSIFAYSAFVVCSQSNSE